jgi:hypothetical protein
MSELERSEIEAREGEGQILRPLVRKASSAATEKSAEGAA